MKIFETIQRSENGGAPLCNETAHDLRIDHGTGVLVISTRQFVAFLLRCEQTEEVKDLLQKYNKFLFPVDKSEGAPKKGGK